MSLCERCGKAEHHGYRRDGRDSTVYFWCPAKESHDQGVTLCTEFERGKPKRFYRDGSEL